MTVDNILISLLANDPALINSLRPAETLTTNPSAASIGMLPYQYQYQYEYQYQYLLQNALLQQQQQQQQQQQEAASIQAAMATILREATLQELLLSRHPVANANPQTTISSAVPANTFVPAALSKNTPTKKDLWPAPSTVTEVEALLSTKPEVQTSVRTTTKNIATTQPTTKRTPERTTKQQQSPAFSTVVQKSAPRDEQSLTMPQPDDVLLGQGRATSSHPGNQFLTDLILAKKEDYALATKKQKRVIANNIIKKVHNRGGRFLQKDRGSALWYVAIDNITRDKISRALREGAPELRKGLQDKSTAAEALMGLSFFA